jgi:inorganic pyrophosphatase/exopolyphosphatase
VQHLEKHGMNLAWVHENILFKEDLVQLDSVEGIGLVDFNLLPKNLENLSSKVKAVIDHHVDNGAYKDTCKIRNV